MFENLRLLRSYQFVDGTGDIEIEFRYHDRPCTALVYVSSQGKAMEILGVTFWESGYWINDNGYLLEHDRAPLLVEVQKLLV